MKKNKNGDFELSSQEVDLFFAEAEFWIQEFGIGDWWVTFYLEDNVNEDGVTAWCSAHPEARNATIGLHKVWKGYGEELLFTDFDIQRTAFHEVCELVLHPLRSLIPGGIHTNNDMSEKNHAVIKRFENLMFKNGRYLYGREEKKRKDKKRASYKAGGNTRAKG